MFTDDLFCLLQAAARHKCTYLINFHKKQFLDHRGDSNWLNGLSYVPSKLHILNDVNKILAHQPWLINLDDIKVRILNIQYHVWVHSILLTVFKWQTCIFY